MNKRQASTKLQLPPAAAAFEASIATSPTPKRDRAIADLALKPSSAAAVAMSAYAQMFGNVKVDICALADSLEAGTGEVLAGDMKRAEAMLYAQAHTLQAIFTNLALRASRQEYVKNWEAFLRMALKAQNQCRMTLETLSTIKNPPVVFAKQANINNGGQQQVNNGGPASPELAASRARSESKNAPTKLLEALHGERLDNRTQSATGQVDPQLVPVGEVDGTKNRRGQGPRGAQQGSGRQAAGGARAGEKAPSRA